MSVIVEPANPMAGQMITFKLKYEGSDGPPNDVHVELEKDGTPSKVTGYDNIPPALNPVAGFDLPIPPTPDWTAPGVHKFHVRWTLNGDLLRLEKVSVRTLSTPAAPKQWDWATFLAWICAGALGSALGSVLLNWWTVAAIIPCLLTGAFGGGVASALGQLASWLLDDPRIRWTVRSSFLFGLFFSLTFSVLFGLLAVGLEREAVAREEIFNRVTFGVAFISGFLTPLLGGLLNNLRNDSNRI